MPSDNSITLNNLLTGFYDTAPPEAGIEILFEFGKSGYRSLRDYLSGRRISVDIIRQRGISPYDCVRNYLTFVSLLAVCWHRRFIPAALPHKVRNELKLFFTDNNIREYYRQNFSASLLKKIDGMIEREPRKWPGKKVIIPVNAWLLLIRSKLINRDISAFVSLILSDDTTNDTYRRGEISFLLNSLHSARYGRLEALYAREGRSPNREYETELKGFAAFADYLIQYSELLRLIQDKDWQDDLWAIDKFSFRIKNNVIGRVVLTGLLDLQERLAPPDNLDEEIFEADMQNLASIKEGINAVNYLYGDEFPIS